MTLDKPLGKYTLLEELGRGGFGTVYKAQDEIGRVVAVKVLRAWLAEDPTAIERFKREARAAGELFHNRIASTLDFEQTEEHVFLVMRYVEGKSLWEVIEEQGRLPWSQALKIVTQVAEGLDYAHQRGFIHRDIKPANILYNDEDGAVLTDFGLVKAAQVSGLTSNDAVIGTPMYMAPETFSGGETSPATDVYSLACVFYEMITGEVLFSGDSPGQVIVKHMLEDPAFPEYWPEDVPLWVEDILKRALEKDPLRRYQDVNAFITALQEGYQENGIGELVDEVTVPREDAPAVVDTEVPTLVPPPVAEEIPEKTPVLEDGPAQAPIRAQIPEPLFSPVPARPPSRRVNQRVVWMLFGGLVLVSAVTILVFGGMFLWRQAREGRGPLAGFAPQPSLTMTASSLGHSATALEVDEPPPQTVIPSPTETEIPAVTSTPLPTITPSPLPTTSLTPLPTATLGIGSRQVWETDGMVMVYIPEGEFWMGTSEDEPASNYEFMDERPLHSVFLNAFWIDSTEVTNAMFQQFVEATGYQTDAEVNGWSWVGYYKRNSDRYKKEDGAFWNSPLGAESSIRGLEDHPVVNVSWNDAFAYCAWAGRRLPTEAEWEKAARGTDGRRYPWGDQPLAGEYLNFADVSVSDEPDQDGIDDGFRYTAPVGSYPAGAGPYGVMDMAGNVWEWVADWYAVDYYVTTPYNNPEGPSSGKYRVLRGGCWIDKAERTRAANRAWGNYAFEPDASANYVGFRCAMDGGP